MSFKIVHRNSSVRLDDLLNLVDERVRPSGLLWVLISLVVHVFAVLDPLDDPINLGNAQIIVVEGRIDYLHDLGGAQTVLGQIDSKIKLLNHFSILEEYGPLTINTDYSSSDTSFASSTSDEDKKMAKKAKKGKDHKYKPEKVKNYESALGQPTYRKKGEERKKTRFLPPPDDYQATDVDVPMDLPKDVGKMDEAGAKTALLKYVNKKTCWRKGAAEGMTLSNLKLSCAYVYEVQVYTETRKCKWKTEGYKKGSHFEPVQAGTAPLPWDLDTKCPGGPGKFVEGKKKVDVPYSSSVRKCWYCKGKGQTKCRNCKGKKHFPCDNCGESGKVTQNYTDENGEEQELEVMCGHCMGAGQTGCPRCHAQGHYKCKNCGGHKKLRWYIQANCKWDKHKEEKVFEDTALPDKLVKDVKGQVMFTDEQQLLKPLKEFPESHVLAFSKDLLPKMMEKYKKEGRILRMRHTVLAVPVTEVDWRWEDQGGSFFIYGLDQECYFPEYPQQCCCSLL